MDNPRSCASPGLDAFLAAVVDGRNPPGNDEFVATILDEGDPASTAALAATVFDECDPAGAAAFAAILLEYDPNQPRDWRGRWTAVCADEDSDAEIRRRAEKALGGPTGTSTDEDAAGADRNSVIFGKRNFTPKDGSGSFEASFAGFDSKGNVLLKKADGKPFTADPQSFSDSDKKYLADLAKLHDDEGFMAGLKAKPANVHIDSTGVSTATRQLQWEAKVVRDIGMLSELDTGRKVLDAAKGREDQFTITAPRKSTDDNSAEGGTVYFNAGKTTGAPTKSGNNDRPPFLGLGQEIFNAVGNLANKNATLGDRERAGLGIGKQLRQEYNVTIDDPQRLKEVTKRYPDWGTEAVDAEVRTPTRSELP